MVDFVVGGREDTWGCVLRGVIAVVRIVITVPGWIIGSIYRKARVPRKLTRLN